MLYARVLHRLRPKLSYGSKGASYCLKCPHFRYNSVVMKAQVGGEVIAPFHHGPVAL